MVYRFKHLAVALSAALLLAFAFASCAPISDASVGAGDTAGNASFGAEAEISINLPQIAARSNSLRSMTPEETDDARKQTASFRVTFSCNYKTVRREVGGGVDTVSASFYVGTDVSVMVECLNSSGEVIVRTEPKTVKIRSRENNVSFKLSEDGTRIYPENPEPEPEPEPTTVNITFEAGYYISNASPTTWSEMRDVTLPQSGDRTVGGSINETMSLSGFTFRGWVVKENYNPNATSYSQQQLITTYPSTAATLIGIWEENAPNTFTLSYSWGDGVSGVQGNLPSAQNNIASGTDVTVTIPTVTRVGYDFLGWSATQNASAATYDANNSQIVITQDTVLYAVWSLKTYSITYDANNGTIGTNGTSSFTINDTNISFGTVTRTGYTFTNWTYNGTAVAENASALIAQAGNSTTITLTAQWTPTTYNITYELDGGQNGSDAKPSYTIADQTFNLPTPTKTDSLFMGWYEDSSFSGTKVTEIQQGSTGNKTFYAKWAYAIKMVSITGGTVPLTAAYQPTVSNFLISDAEITQAQWYDVVGNNGYGTEPNEGDNYPMHYVNWYDAIVFCNMLSKKENKTPCYTVAGKDSNDPSTWGNPPDQTPSSTTWEITCNWNADGYRLPTEAEWEYAGRAGNTGTNGNVYGNGQGGTTVDVSNIDNYAWHKGNASGATHPVKGKSPNGYGLYDMNGNVMEWCWDYYGEPYDTQEDIDPSGTTTPNGNRLCRGGSYLDDTSRCIVGSGTDSRDGRATALARYQQAGFRVVCRP